MSFWQHFKKIAAVLALVLLLNTVFTALTVSALPAQSDLQKVQEELNLNESEIQELLLFIQENSSSIEEAIQADPDLKSKVEQYNEYSKEVSLILAFAEIARSNTSVISHSTDFSLQSEISPAVWPIVWPVVAAIIKAAIKKKMGKKIVKQIGDQFDKVVWPKLEPGIKKQYEKYGYSRNKGPGQSGAANGGEYLRLHVFTSQSRNQTRWHWHQLDDNWSNHHGNVDLFHNSLPKWGTE
ncbi:hypothetical protein [Paenibacillus faecalis]|uniref:hypothetical protein n=1 Tax=Paenibacillus faecalis TaxID=2079532 RepID=UPI000D0EA05C|nr:hypothetical protein [Paenibacillus faecalis]